METIGTFEAKTHLAALIEQVASEGKSFTITKHGVPKAALVPVHESPKPRRDIKEIMAEMEEFRKEHGGFGVWDAILCGLVWGGGAAAVVLGIAAAVTGALPAMSIIAIAGVVGLGVAAVAGEIQMASHNEKVMKEYNEYLSDVSSSARTQQVGKSPRPTVEFDNDVPTDRFVPKILEQNQQRSVAEKSMA